MNRPIGPREFYYITHIGNLPSILREGILSHLEVQKRGLEPERIYNTQVVEWRARRITPDNRSLWAYANLYIQPRNPMLYRVLREQETRGQGESIVVLGVDSRVLERPGVWVTDGNAARRETRFYPPESQYLHRILREVGNLQWWSEADSSKRRIMAEVLVPESIPPRYLHTVYVPGLSVRNRVMEILQEAGVRLEVVPEPEMFFLPRMERVLPGTPITLIEGDMFFSRMQTLTISVNTVGVMGKGQAARVRFQFPDAYVAYQEACRRKALDIGRLVLYRRETPITAELTDLPLPFPGTEPPQETWFLFFPTKRHWRERSRLEYIEAGLAWIRRHYREEGIESLALPALGCGLGGLSWAQVGPVMVRALRSLDIPVQIYLPLERRVPEEQLQPEFLLGP